ncbi:MAG TPA: hypothetical protein VEV85_05250 [Bryobacteraceae bacterium]|nr:hypothetical protein [Bryobacteraceae bacterium]
MAVDIRFADDHSTGVDKHRIVVQHHLAKRRALEVAKSLLVFAIRLPDLVANQGKVQPGGFAASRLFQDLRDRFIVGRFFGGLFSKGSDQGASQCGAIGRREFRAGKNLPESQGLIDHFVRKLIAAGAG